MNSRDTSQPPVDPAADSVAGEEDPGATLDLVAADMTAGTDTRQEPCAHCGGTGRVGDVNCPVCEGSGKVRMAKIDIGTADR